MDANFEAHPKAPQYEDADVDYAGLFPAREVLVRVADGCGLHADTYTDAEGHYSIVFPSWCGEKDATVTLYSISTPGEGKRVALGVHTASPDPDGYEDLVDDPLAVHRGRRRGRHLQPGAGARSAWRRGCASGARCWTATSTTTRRGHCSSKASSRGRARSPGR